MKLTPTTVAEISVRERAKLKATMRALRRVEQRLGTTRERKGDMALARELGHSIGGMLTILGVGAEMRVRGPIIKELERELNLAPVPKTTAA